jgi:hypothetical protein
MRNGPNLNLAEPKEIALREMTLFLDGGNSTVMQQII